MFGQMQIQNLTQKLVIDLFTASRNHLGHNAQPQALPADRDFEGRGQATRFAVLFFLIRESPRRFKIWR